MEQNTNKFGAHFSAINPGASAAELLAPTSKMDHPPNQSAQPHNVGGQHLYYNPTAANHASYNNPYDQQQQQQQQQPTSSSRVIKSEIYDQRSAYSNISTGIPPIEASNTNLPYYYLPPPMDNRNVSQVSGPTGFNPSQAPSYPATRYLPSSSNQAPPSLGYPQARPSIANTPATPFPAPAYPPASQFVCVRTQGQGGMHGYPARYPPGGYLADMPGPSNQPDYPGFVAQTDFQAQPMQLMPNLAHLPNNSMATTFSQYSMENNRPHMAPPTIDLASYTDLGHVERSVFAHSMPSTASTSYAPNNNEDTTEEEKQKQSIYQKIKCILRIAQIFPKREDIRENSKIKVPPQSPPSSWCHVFYYEMKERVGEPYKASGDRVIIDGLCAPSDGTRFCLGILSNANRNPVCVAPRKQIGRGCLIFKEGDNIYLESLSESPIFVQAPLYAEFNRDHLATVYRLPQNMRIQVFDKPTFERLVAEATALGYNSVYTLLAMCTLRVSLVKGWGEQYRRQTITACPCWLEVQFPEPMQVLDKILMSLGGPLNDEIHSFT